MLLTQAQPANGHADAREGEGEEGGGAAAEPVEPPDRGQVGRQLEGRRDGEGGVDGVVQVADVADVRVEEAGDEHPGVIEGI